jgi:uncharacterized lipoprotein NlpE involved in copper resistance
MKLIIAIVALSLGIAGCSAMQARDDSFQARDAYLACVKQNQTQLANCEDLKQTYEVKRQHYLEVMGAE